MRFNDKELRHYVKSAPAQLEGTLVYDSKDGRKERKVRLVNSLFLMYRVSPNGVFTDLEPTELLVLTNCTVKQDTSRPNSFQIVSPGSPFNSSYTFTCKSATELLEWISALQMSSSHGLHNELQNLRQQIDRQKKSHSRHSQSKQSAAILPAAPPKPQPSVDDMLLIDFS